jgi:iron complex outermembrane receptor protein
MAFAASVAAQDGGDVSKLSLEELLATEVTSVSRKPEPRSSAADAVYVITADDIHRSGVRSLAEALRLAPGVQVARISNDKWAIGVRGFASSLARSVLVLIDGRSVYSPLFAGTYWEIQDYLLDDVDRIEVIRGPGGTLWGANAFNGVINIITKTARETQGGYLMGGGGTEERAFGAVRYGGRLGKTAHYRGYATGWARDASDNPFGPEFDDSRMGQAGFRTDWDPTPRDAVTVHGDVYQGAFGEQIGVTQYRPPGTRIALDDTTASGANLVGRWTRLLGPESQLSLQAYFDNTFRDQTNFEEIRNTGDLDLQHRIGLRWRQELIWGLAYRVTSDQTSGPPTVEFDPRDRTDHLVSGFLQDEITLVPERLRVALGTKLEHNDYSGFEIQPSGRLLWTPATHHTVWASAARAVRTPTRTDQDLRLTVLPVGSTTFLRVAGDEDFDSEKVVNYQAGYRVQPLAGVFLDAVGFYNRYTDLLSIEPGSPFLEAEPGPAHLVLPFVEANGLHGETWGAELAADAVVRSWWRLSASYAYLDIQLQPDSSSRDRSQVAAEGSSPQHQVSLRSFMNFPAGVRFDVGLRWIDSLPGQGIGSYFEADARLAKRFGRRLELSVIGQNLVQPEHREFAGGTEIERGVYGQFRWWWW